MQVSTDVLLTAHAKLRMAERGWSKDEVLNAIARLDRRVVVKTVYKVVTVYPKDVDTQYADPNDAEMTTPNTCSAKHCKNACKKGNEMTTPNTCSAKNCKNACKKGKDMCGPCQKKPGTCSSINCTNACKKGRHMCGACQKTVDTHKNARKARKKLENAEDKRMDALEQLADAQAVSEYYTHASAIAIAKQFHIQP